MNTTITRIVPQAWIGCLACYNDGRLVGEWLDADGLEDDDTLAAICDRPGHEELWGFDLDFIPGGEMSPAEAARKARAMNDYLAAADDANLPPAVALGYLEAAELDDPDLWPRLGRDVSVSVADSETEYVLDALEDHQIALPEWLSVDYEHTFEQLTSGETKIRHHGVLYIFHA